MAITPMAKVMIVTHRSQAAELLERLQAEGICQILNAEQAVVSKDTPELAENIERPKDIEELLARLEKTLAFLKQFAEPRKGLENMLAPRTVVNRQLYNQVTSDEKILNVVDQSEQIRAKIDKLNADCDDLNAAVEMLSPWKSLETPLQEIGLLDRTVCLPGMLPAQNLQEMQDRMAEFGAEIQQVGTAGSACACLVVSLKQTAADVQKMLRSAEFEPVSFESMTGTVAEVLKQHDKQLADAHDQLRRQYQQAAALAENLLKLQILCDHYSNLLNRENTRGTAPATRCAVILEGWVKNKNYQRLENVVAGFEAANVTKIQPADDEEVPVEIENKKAVRPFEVITRLYGMPKYFNIDPTVFMAPFFALFFALCLTDAGYGLVIMALMFFFIKKLQGDKKLMWMLGICAAATVAAGALTGGWFGDAIQTFIPALKPLRQKLMWFDPLEEPMKFFKLALALGYIQILTGWVIALLHNLKRRNFVAAVCDQLTWLVMLNSIVILLASKAGVVSPQTGTFFGYLALAPAATILLFSHRQGTWAGRIGMGVYNLFSTIFLMGDVLSYLRLMALGMVTAGLAMAINVVADKARKTPVVGIVLMVLILVGGHLFNIAINALGAFVHTLRLQYVEFFPKFLIADGRQFQPLSKQYKHIYVKN